MARRPPMASEPRRTVALIPAAGLGLRLGGAVRKQFRPLGGLPLLVHSLRVFQSSPVIDAVILAVPEADLQYCRMEIIEPHGFSKVTRGGGRERTAGFSPPGVGRCRRGSPPRCDP